MILIIFGLFAIIYELYYSKRIDARWEQTRRSYHLQGIEVRRTEAWDQSTKKEGKFVLVTGICLLTFGLLLTFGPSQVISILRLEFLSNPILAILGIGIGLPIAFLGIYLISFSEKVWERQMKRSKLEFVSKEVPRGWYSESVLLGGLAILIGLAILFFSIASLR
ncbi:MAG: hypothetical protein DWQ07_05890 [Chloroflexi bacterium]|nr:MAG: hypothetical protein DWQ07_05890 [Chloroflexota bacterium]MBL1196700.1 hypothetical protein [Chloroflexota bacterium]NOH13993.1 hypothetical protein [Chloroflexota bacterium]